jgi:hypothetical protein
MINLREYNWITDLYNMKLDWNLGVTFESYHLGRCFKNLEWNILNCGGFIEYRGQ